MRWTDFNRRFYDDFAGEFSRSRQAINPGIRRALEALDRSSVLDVGCGDARVSRALPEASRYLGLDFSAGLLGQAARGRREARPLRVLSDFSSPLPVRAQSFESVVCFAVLHHLVDRALLMREMKRVLKPGGRLALSVWQIAHDARMRKKIVRELGNGDYVLGWSQGGHGQRFVHEVTEAELRDLAAQAGLDVVEVYRSDGRSGDLGLYGVLSAGRG